MSMGKTRDDTMMVDEAADWIGLGRSPAQLKQIALGAKKLQNSKCVFKESLRKQTNLIQRAPELRKDDYLNGNISGTGQSESGGPTVPNR